MVRQVRWATSAVERCQRDAVSEVELVSRLVDAWSQMRRGARAEAIRLNIVVERVAHVIAERTPHWTSVVCNIALHVTLYLCNLSHKPIIRCIYVHIHIGLFYCLRCNFWSQITYTKLFARGQHMTMRPYGSMIVATYSDYRNLTSLFWSRGRLLAELYAQSPTLITVFSRGSSPLAEPLLTEATI